MYKGDNKITKSSASNDKQVSRYLSIFKSPFSEMLVLLFCAIPCFIALYCNYYISVSLRPLLWVCTLVCIFLISGLCGWLKLKVIEKYDENSISEKEEEVNLDKSQQG